METYSRFALADGRPITTNSAVFRKRLPISTEMIARISKAEESHDPDIAEREAISALVNAVVALESRGVRALRAPEPTPT